MTLKLVTKKLTDTKSYIEDLKNDDPEPNLNACLSDCLELYSNTIGDLEDAEEDYQSRKYREASEETDEVLTSLTNCEDGFKEKGLRSPLTERSNHAFQLYLLYSLRLLPLRAGGIGFSIPHFVQKLDFPFRFSSREVTKNGVASSRKVLPGLDPIA